MGVNSEGKLVPMMGLRENSITEAGESGSENDGEEKGEKSWNVTDFLSYPVSKGLMVRRYL